MNKIEKELHGYINGTERMSGFDSYDNAEGDSYFDGDDMSYFDGDDMSYASGASAAAQVSQPYIVQYQNTTTTNLSAILFGFNDYGTLTNGGNPTGIVITNLQGGSYQRLLSQSNNKPFVAGRFRFSVDSLHEGQLSETVTINHVDANGRTTTTPVPLSAALDAYQYIATIRDLVRNVTVDGNTYLSFTLLAGATLTIQVYPTRLISAKGQLNSGQLEFKAVAPKLSGKNSPNVIIQTTQDVKGIAGR